MNRKKTIITALIIMLLIVVWNVLANVSTSALELKNGPMIYTSAKEPREIIRVTKGGREKVLATNVSTSSVSPSGQKVAYVSASNNRLYVMDNDGGTKMMVTRKQGAKDHSLTWLADGRKLAFVREELDADGVTLVSSIYTIRPDGKDERRITLPSKVTQYRTPAWSPDGKEIAYERRQNSVREIVIKSLDTYNERVITKLSDDIDSRLSWSPNGKKLLFNDSATEIYTIWPDGSHRAVISDGESYNALWSPNGEQIVFFEDKSGDEVSVSEPDGTVRQISLGSSIAGVSMVKWAPNMKQLVVSGEEGVFIVDLGELEGSVRQLTGSPVASIDWLKK